MKSTLLRVLLTTVTMAAPVPWRAEQIAPVSWRIEQADVRVTCPLTIGGSFDARRPRPQWVGHRQLPRIAAVRRHALGRPSHPRHRDRPAERASTREISRGRQGLRVRCRNAHEHRAVGLESDAPEGKGAFTASLTLHGVTKAVTGSVDVRRANTGGLRVKALFPVTLSDYSIPFRVISALASRTPPGPGGIRGRTLSTSDENDRSSGRLAVVSRPPPRRSRCFWRSSTRGARPATTPLRAADC